MRCSNQLSHLPGLADPDTMSQGPRSLQRVIAVWVSRIEYTDDMGWGSQTVQPALQQILAPGAPTFLGA